MEFRHRSLAPRWEYGSRRLSWFLDGIASGEMQLPDFQRNQHVTEEHVSDLLASVCEGLPIGAVTMFSVEGKSPCEFEALRGTDARASSNKHPTHLVVDGQQRLAPLFQSLHSTCPTTIVQADKKVGYRKYYIDMHQAIQIGSLLKAVIAVEVTADGLAKSSRDLDLADPTVQFANCIVPANSILEFSPWEDAFSEHWRQPGQDRLVEKKVTLVCRRFYYSIVETVRLYDLPMILMSGEESWRNVVKIYQKAHGRPPEAVQPIAA